MRMQEMLDIARQAEEVGAEYDLVKGALEQAQSRQSVEIEVQGHRFNCDGARIIRLAKFLQGELEFIVADQQPLVDRVKDWK